MASKKGKGRGGAVKPDPDAAPAPAPSPSPQASGAAASAPKKFEPKVAPRRAKKSEVKSEPEEVDVDRIKKLIEDAQTASQRRGFRTGDSKATATRVAFGSGGSASFTTKSSAGFAKSRGSGGGGGGGAGGGGWRGPDKKPAPETGAMLAEESGSKTKPSVFDTMMDDTSYKPISLPLRRPPGVGTEFSDDEDDDEDATNTLIEDQVPAAKELGLETESPEERLLFLQFPSLLPASSGPELTLESYPHGLMGKLRIYESGAIKLHLGDSVMNVYPGTRCVFSQELVAINSNTKKCAFLGDVGQRLVVTPDIDGLLDGSSS